MYPIYFKPVFRQWYHHFPYYWRITCFVERIYGSRMYYPTKGQCWRAFVFPYLLAWTSCWTNSRVTGNLKRRYAHVSSLLCAAVVVEHTLGSFIVALVLLPGLYEPVFMKGIWQYKYHNSKLFAHGSIPKFIAVQWRDCPMITLKQNVFGDNSVYAYNII